MGKLVLACVTALLGITLAAAPALATNGMNMIAFGGQESGMAGASLGVSDNPVAMNNNPAGLAQIKGHELTFGVAGLTPKLSHSDMFNGSVDGEDNIFLLPMLAYAQNIGKVNQQLSLGAALNLGYSTMEMKFFPNTVAPGMLYGMNLQDVYSFGYGVKVGAQYKFNETVTLGLVYTSKSQLNFKRGTMTYAGVGSFDAEVSGFEWPQSVGAGVAVRPFKRLLLALDLTWINWKDAI